MKVSYDLWVSQTSAREAVKISDRRSQSLKIFIFTSLVIPVTLDFFFFETSAARYGRIILFLSIGGFVLLNYKLFLSQTIVGVGSLLLVIALFVLGTMIAVSRGGVFTPNFLLLLLLLFVVAANFDLYDKALDSIGAAVFALLFLSAIAILLQLNPMNSFYSDNGYPVFLDFVGIPGRNYGVFAHPNSLGQIAAISVAFIACSKFNKLYLLLPLFCLFKCGSRTSIISTMLIIIIMMILKILPEKQPKKWVRQLELRSVIIATLVTIFLVLSVLVVEYVAFIDATGLTGRVSIWQSSLELVRGNSFFGLGWDWESRAIESQLLNIWAVSAHNAFFEIGFATGIIGLCIFLFMYAKVFSHIEYLHLREKFALLVILFSGVTESYFSLQYPNTLTFLMLIIVISSHQRRVLA